MHNEIDEGACALCERPLDPSFVPADEKIFIDMTRFAFLPFCKELLRSRTMLLPLIFPIFVILYGVFKLLRRPFLSPYYICQTPKLHRVDLKNLRNFDTKSFNKSEAALLRIGFERLLDLEDRSRAQITFERLYLNRGNGAFASMFIQKLTGRVLYVEFFAITAGQKIISYINGEGISENDDPQIFIRYVGPITVEETWKLFAETLTKRGEALLVIEPRRLFPILSLVRIANITRGLAKKILIKSVGNAALGGTPISLCYHHPATLAVRVCATCHIPLCETCYREVQGAYYCQRCVPVDTTALKLVESPWGFVGVGPRMVAAVLDLCIAIMSGITAFLPFYFIGRSLLHDHWQAFAFIMAQPFFAAFIYWYFIFQVARKGQTFGKKIGGLHVIGRQGERPGLAAAAIRFAFSCISFLFIFPLIGYLFIPFRKNKNGFHDQLAGTYVVARNPKRKAIFSWLLSVPALLLIIFIIAGAVIYLTGLSGNPIATEVALPKRWEIVKNENAPWGKVMILDRMSACLIADSASLSCLDMKKGDTIWRVTGLNNPHVPDADTVGPLCIIELNDNATARLSYLDDRTGKKLWSTHIKASAGDNWSVIGDSNLIAIYTKDTLIVFSTQGESRWGKKLTSPLNVALHATTAVNDKSLRIWYKDGGTKVRELTLAAETGRLLKTTSRHSYQFMTALPGDYQLSVQPDHRQALYYLPDDRIIWSIEDSLEYISGFSREAVAGRGIPALFYGRSRAYRGEDGAIAFEYPRDATYLFAARDYLVLFRVADSSTGAKKGFLIIDNTTGTLLHTFADTILVGLTLVTEDDRSLYFRANEYPSMPKGDSLRDSSSNICKSKSPFSTTTMLIIMDKNDFSVQKQPIGKNLMFAWLRLFPEDRSFFISAPDRIGCYTYASRL